MNEKIPPRSGKSPLTDSGPFPYFPSTNGDENEHFEIR